MLKLKSAKEVECPTCHDHGYIQLVIGGSETCLECSGSKKWNLNQARRHSKIAPVRLK